MTTIKRIGRNPATDPNRSRGSQIRSGVLTTASCRWVEPIARSSPSSITNLMRSEADLAVDWETMARPSLLSAVVWSQTRQSAARRKGLEPVPLPPRGTLPPGNPDLVVAPA